MTSPHIRLDLHPISEPEYQDQCRFILEKEGALVLKDFFSESSVREVVQASSGREAEAFYANPRTMCISPRSIRSMRKPIPSTARFSAARVCSQMIRSRTIHPCGKFLKPLRFGNSYARYWESGKSIPTPTSFLRLTFILHRKEKNWAGISTIPPLP